MNHTLLIALAICIMFTGCTKKEQSSIPQHPILGFRDIAWGDSPASAKSKMLQIPGVRFTSDSAGMHFSDGSYMNHPVQRWILDFWRGSLFNYAQVYFVSDSYSGSAIFADLDAQARQLYGAPTNSFDSDSTKHHLWAYPVTSSKHRNTMSVILDPSGNAYVWYGGSGYIDSLEHVQK